jgi:hypothetical protein
VPLDDVSDLVTEGTSELVEALGVLDEAAVHINVAPGSAKALTWSLFTT